MPNLLGRLLGSGGSTETAPDAPTIAYSSRTTTTIVIAHTPPVDTTDYTQTRIYYGVEGASATGSQTSSTAQNVTFSGLTAGTRYWFIAVSESATTPLYSPPAAPVFVHTLFSSASSNGASAIKAAIKTLMSGVAGMDAATIHARTRRPHAMTPEDLATLYTSSSAINGWEIEEEGFSAEWGMANYSAETFDRFTIRGIYKFDDPENSEATFRTILQAITVVLNRDVSLAGTCRRHEAVQCPVYGHRQITNETVHYAELSLVCIWTSTT